MVCTIWVKTSSGQQHRSLSRGWQREAMIYGQGITRAHLQSALAGSRGYRQAVRKSKHTCWTLPPLRSLCGPALHARPAGVGHGPHACAPAEAKPRVRCCLHVCASRAQQVQALLSSNPLSGRHRSAGGAWERREAGFDLAWARSGTRAYLEESGGLGVEQAAYHVHIAGHGTGTQRRKPKRCFTGKRLAVPALFKWCVAAVAAVCRPSGAFRSCQAGKR